MTTCPSGVNYMHLVDEARAHVEETYRRPLFERLLRNVLAYTMPRPALFRLSLIGAKLASPLAPVAKSFGATRIAALLGLVPKRMPTPERIGQPGTYPATGEKKGRVALLMGCVQSVLDPGINAATIRLLTRLGYEVVVSGEEACCGSLTHHMGWKEMRWPAPAARSTSGRRPMSRPSSSRRRDAAPPSRTMATCCAMTRPMPRRRRPSAPRRRT